MTTKLRKLTKSVCGNIEGREKKKEMLPLHCNLNDKIIKDRIQQ